jgi:hypothetical protein
LHAGEKASKRLPTVLPFLRENLRHEVVDVDNEIDVSIPRRESKTDVDGSKALITWTTSVRQVARKDVPVVGDCPDFRAGFAKRKWDCPLHAFRLLCVHQWDIIPCDLPYVAP